MHKAISKIKNLAILIFLATFALAANAQTGAVSSSTGVVKGVLPNGLTYYILQNDAPKGKVNFYLMQDVGAILEDDNQNGLAHFLEHMAFNGTTNFPENTIMAEFSAKGLKSSINAHTYMDKTIYHFTDIPTNDVAFTDKCLLILYDWCNSLTLSQEKIDSERLVILEEKRTRNDLNFRIKEASDPLTFNNSKYAQRNIIGTEDILKNFKRDELVNFYHKWYRADLQAIVVIGDVDVFQTETKIKRLFSQVPKPENPAERYHITIPDNKETLFEQVRDVESKSKSINLGYRVNFNETHDGTYQNLLVNIMVQARARQLVKQDSLDLRHVSIAFQKIAYGYAQYAISVIPNEGRDKEALQAVLNMHKDITQNGFTEKEYEEATNFYLNAYRGNAKANGKTTNGNYFDDIDKNFIDKVDIIDANAKLKGFQNYIKNNDGISIGKIINDYVSSPNKSILLVGNKTTSLLSKEDIIAIENAVTPVQVLPDFNKNEETAPAREVLPAGSVLNGSAVEKSEKIKELGAEKWTLANGATVIYRENPYQKNVVTLYGTSDGGTSVLRGDELAAGMAFAQYNSFFGIEGFTPEELEKYYKDNQIGASVKLGSISEDVFLFSTFSNVEDMFKLLYCQFEKPAFYADKFNETSKKVNEALKNAPITYMNLLSDSVNNIRYGSEHHLSMNYQNFQRINQQVLEKVYRDRFSDASNFTFYIVGGISKAKAKAFAEKYIGSIENKNSKEVSQKVTMNFPEKEQLKKLNFKNNEKKAGIIYTLLKEEEYTTKKALTLSIVNSYLSDKFQRVLRDMEKGTYGVQSRPVSKQISNDTNEMGFDVSFECNPERANDLNETLRETMDVIVEMGLLPDDFKLIKDKLVKKGMPQKDNMYYVSAIKNFINFGENDDDPESYSKALESITIEDANKFLLDMYQNGKLLNVVWTAQ